MAVYCMRLLRRLAAVFAIVVLVTGCAPATQPIPNTGLVEPVLTVVETPVQVAKPDQAGPELQKDQSVPVAVNDVMTAAPTGRGLLRFKDRVSVDLLRDSEFRITGVQPEAGDFLFIQLEQTRGHIRVQLSDNANAKVRLVTSIATITTLKPGTDFVICHNAVKLTCIVVLEGEVEVVGQGKLVTVKGGEATYILKDNPPFPAICGNNEEVLAWYDRKLGTGEVGPISQLVSSWDAVTCAEAAQKALVTPAPSLPSAAGMVKIEAGEYIVGADPPNANQVQKQTLALDAFWIDQFEVTNARYQAFLTATGHAAPAVWPGGENRPVAGVTWNDAEAFCAWAGKRLPTEAEWEAAARGKGDNPPLYPWGNDTQAGGMINSLPRSDTYDAGAFAFNVSPAGVYDMAGNVWEWVGEPYASVAEYTKVLRGGRFGLIKDMAHREQAAPDNERFVANAGFRCAADQVEGE